jgi:hypothetical protein
VVLIEQEESNRPPRLLAFGKYRTGRLSAPEDFKPAEWRGKEEFDKFFGP